MAANMGHQSLMGGGTGVMPSLAQEIAASNYADSRDSFHDYIYSKLILGEDKEGTSTPVFPSMPNYNTTSSMGPPPAPRPPSSSSYNNQNMDNNLDAPMPSSSPITNMHNMPHHNNMGVPTTIPSAPHVSTLKPGNSSSKKKLHVKGGMAGHHQNNSLVEINVPDHEGLMNNKKKKSHKKKEKTNICDVCGRGFAEKYTLNRHMLTHTHVKPYSCTKCNMAFSRSDGLAKHMNAGHRRIDAHHCDVCGGTFNSEVSFEQHRREYGSTLPFVCNLCMLAFSQCCHLNYHMKSHSLKSDYGVDVDSTQVEAVDDEGLIPEDFSPPKNSMREATNKIASLSFLSSLSLNPDIHIKHEVDGEEDALDEGKDGSEQDHVISGGLSASKENDGCNDRTGNSGDISDLEMRKYFNIKVPNPNFKEGSTNASGAMDADGKAIASGAGEDGLFRCQLCNKGFTRKYHMQRHVRLHTRGPVPKAHLLDWTRRPYACGVCKMGFTRQHHLTRHMLIHTGERPHSCHICGKAFRRFTNLSLHVRTVHGSERPYKCPLCGRGFPRVYSLQRHLLTHGKNNDATLLAKAGLLNISKENGISTGDDNGGNTANSTSTNGENNGGNRFMGNLDGNTIINDNANTKPAADSGKSDSTLMNEESKSGRPGQFDQHGQQHQMQQQQQQYQNQQQPHQQPQPKTKGKGSQKNKKNKNASQSSQSHFPQSQQTAGLLPMGNMSGDHLMPQNLMSQQQQHQSPSSAGGQQDMQFSSDVLLTSPMSQPPLNFGGNLGGMRTSSAAYAHHQTGNGDRSPFQMGQQPDGPPQSSSNTNSYNKLHQSSSAADRSHAPYGMQTSHAQVHAQSTAAINSNHRSGSDRPPSASPFNLTVSSSHQQQQNSNNASDRASTPYQGQNPGDRSSTPFLLSQQQQQQQHHHHQQASSVDSSRQQNQNQQMVPMEAHHQRPSANEPTHHRDASAAAALVYSHTPVSAPPNNFQLPNIPTAMASMDLSAQGNRGRLAAEQTLRQIPDFSNLGNLGSLQNLQNLAPSLTMGQMGLNLNDAAAFAHHLQANNLPLFPGNPAGVGGLSYHQQQLVGEALGRMEVAQQVAQQQHMLPVAAHSHSTNSGGNAGSGGANNSSGNRQY